MGSVKHYLLFYLSMSDSFDRKQTKNNPNFKSDYKDPEDFLSQATGVSLLMFHQPSDITQK